jgi:hypothetical protein
MNFDIIIPFLKPIEHLLMNTAISEIMVNPDGSVWIEENGCIEPVSEARFDEGALLTSLEVTASARSSMPTLPSSICACPMAAAWPRSSRPSSIPSP